MDEHATEFTSDILEDVAWPRIILKTWQVKHATKVMWVV